MATAVVAEFQAPASAIELADLEVHIFEEDLPTLEPTAPLCSIITHDREPVVPAPQAAQL